MERLASARKPLTRVAAAGAAIDPGLSSHPELRRAGIQTRFGAGPRFDALEPRVHILERRVDLLINAAAEVERAIQNDVRDREAIAHDIFLALEQAVEPFEPVLHDCLQPGRRFRQDADTVLEELRALGESEGVRAKRVISGWVPL